MQARSDAPIAQLRSSLDGVKKLLSRSRSNQVQAKSIIEGSRDVVKDYFERIRTELSGRGLDDESLAGLDILMQEILTLTQKAALKKAYLQKIKAVTQELNGVEVSLLTASTNTSAGPPALDGKETRIAQTLAALVPSAGASYEQACIDLRGAARSSYRGAAAELREALREVLDHLAPDKAVMEQDSLKLESNQARPTMKQKVRYILISRGKSRTMIEAPENAVELIEDRVGALARSVYSRSSLSTHIGTTKQEVQQVKAYVDVVLGEILEIA